MPMWLCFLRIYYICFHMSNENPEMVRKRKAKGLEGTGRTTQTRTYGGRRWETAHGGQVEIGVRGRGQVLAGVGGRGGWQHGGEITVKSGYSCLLSWQHDAERLKAAALYNTGPHVLKATECIQDTWWPDMRSWGHARSPRPKAGYTGCAITLPPILNAHTLHPQIFPWALCSLWHCCQCQKPHLERGEILLGCNDVDANPGTGHWPLGILWTQKDRKLLRKRKANLNVSNFFHCRATVFPSQ